MDRISTGVFERSDSRDTIGASLFYFILSISLIWGLLITALAANYANEIGYKPTSWLEYLGIGLVVPIIGIIISVKSDNPVISFIGYNLIVVPFGFLLGPVLQKYKPDVIEQACILTAAITAVMGTLGVMFPKFFSRIGGALFLALIGLLIVRVAQLFVPAMANFGFIEYIAAGIFSLYIGFDMYRASTITKTVDNAIDVSVDLYLDIINLFLTLLRISGNSSDD